MIYKLKGVFLDRGLGRKMPSVVIDLSVTEAVVDKVMGKQHDACERNHIWNISLINILGNIV